MSELSHVIDKSLNNYLKTKTWKLEKEKKNRREKRKGTIMFRSTFDNYAPRMTRFKLNKNQPFDTDVRIS